MLSEEKRTELIKLALGGIEGAYAPYSKFFVSAAVLASSGKIYTGINVENASYGAGICAERSAISRAVSEGERKLAAVAIAGGKRGNIASYCPPCGICRQVMREFCDPKDMRVILIKSETDFKEMTLEELFPFSFGPENL